MYQETLQASRLHALLGDATHRLPPHIIAAVETMLAKETNSCFPCGIRSVANDSCNDVRGIGFDPETRRQEALGAILEILHAAQQERGDGVDEPMLGERLLEGLLIAGRLLVESPEAQRVTRAAN